MTSVLRGPWLWRNELAFFAEEFYVGGAFGYRAAFAALDQFADLFDDVRIGEGGDIAGVHAIGDGCKDAAHDFAGARFGHVWDDVDALGASDFADHGFNSGDNFFLHGFVRMHTGFQGDVDFGDAAFHVIHDRDDGGFRDFR